MVSEPFFRRASQYDPEKILYSGSPIREFQLSYNGYKPSEIRLLVKFSGWRVDRFEEGMEQVIQHLSAMLELPLHESMTPDNLTATESAS